MKNMRGYYNIPLLEPYSYLSLHTICERKAVSLYPSGATREVTGKCTVNGAYCDMQFLIRETSKREKISVLNFQLTKPVILGQVCFDMER